MMDSIPIYQATFNENIKPREEKERERESLHEDVAAIYGAIVCGRVRAHCSPVCSCFLIHNVCHRNLLFYPIG